MLRISIRLVKKKRRQRIFERMRVIKKARKNVESLLILIIVEKKIFFR